MTPQDQEAVERLTRWVELRQHVWHHEAAIEVSDVAILLDLLALSQGWKPDREAVARTIDAEAFDIDLEVFATARWGSATEGRVAVAQIMLAERQKAALVKADAILALPTPAPKDEGWRPPEGWVLVPREPTEAMLKAAFVAMNETPSGTWKRMKAEGQTPRRLFDVKMAPRYRAMIAAAPTQSAGAEAS